jgi:hypothetical protein
VEIKMTKRLLLIGMIAVALGLLISFSGVVLAGEAPPFLEVGKSYSSTGYQFAVLEIGKNGWIKVVLRETNQLAWINTNATPMIAPYPAQEMNAPAAVPGQ